MKSTSFDSFKYDPNRLLDALLDKLKLKNDAALSRALDVGPPLISRIRHRRLPIGPSMLIRMHEISGYSIRDLRRLMTSKRVQTRDYNPPELQAEKLQRLIEKAAEHDGKCLAETYIHSDAPLLFECPVHGAFTAKPRHVLAGHWCRQCRNDKQKGETPLRLLDYINRHGGILKSSYVNARTHVVVECRVHGDWHVMPVNLLSRHSWCPRCSRSKPRPGRRKKIEMHMASGSSHA